MKKLKIKELLWMIKKNSNEEVEIVSLGNEEGADKFVKKYCLQFNMKYSEFIPRYKKWNSNCVESPYLFNKKYSPKYFFINNNNFTDYCDSFVFFSDQSENNNKLLKIIYKSKKNIVFVE